MIEKTEEEDIITSKDVDVTAKATHSTRTRGLWGERTELEKKVNDLLRKSMDRIGKEGTSYLR